jgi:hypothetical protein
MSTINGRACVVNGKAVDKVFSNGRQVYGRNLWAVSQSEFGYFSLARQSLVTTQSGDFNKYRKDMIATNGAKYISVRHIGDIPSNLTSGAEGRIIAFDKDQKFISLILRPTADADYFAVGEIPENTVYVLFHIVWGDSGETMIQFGNQETDWTPAPEDILN